MTTDIISIQTTDPEIKLFHSLHTTIAEHSPFGTSYSLTQLKKKLILPPHISQQSIFVALEQGRPQAKLVARCLPPYQGKTSASIGLIGFFDSLEKEKPCRALFDNAIAWLQQQGVSKIVGPMEGGSWFDYRFNIGPFGGRPFLLEPYTPAYYPELWEDYGFTTHTDYYTRHLEDIDTVLPTLRQHYSHALSQGFSFRSLQAKQYKQDIATLYRLSNQTSVTNPLHLSQPITHLYPYFQQIKHLMDNSLINFVCNTNGEEVGFIFALPDHFTAQQILARKPRRLLAYHLAKRHTDALNIYAIGVLPEYHREGLASALSYKTYQAAQNRRLTKSNACLLQEGNPADKINGGSGIVSQRYRLYQYEI